MIIIKITKLNEQLDKEPIKKRAVIKQGAFYYINFPGISGDVSIPASQ